MVWGQGDAAGLVAVETGAGRVGGLICWEHWMPLARQAMHDSGEDIHVAVWPTAHEMLQVASRHYAFEGRCFVIAAGVADANARDCRRSSSRIRTKRRKSWALRGGSAIIAPNGEYVAGPVYEEPCTLVADLDPLECARRVDVVGRRRPLQSAGRVHPEESTADRARPMRVRSSRRSRIEGEGTHSRALPFVGRVSKLFTVGRRRAGADKQFMPARLPRSIETSRGRPRRRPHRAVGGFAGRSAAPRPELRVRLRAVAV